jgi:predicted Zn-dependent peptidase
MARSRSLAWWLVGALVSSSSVGCRPTVYADAPLEAVGDEEEATPSVEEILAASNLPGTLVAPLADDPMGVTIHRLENGMTVYISTDRQKPRFNAWIGTRAGSRMDPPDSTGLAHYLEHMLFKGTSRYGTLDAEKEAPHVERVRELYARLRTIAPDDQAARAAVFAEIDAETQKMAEYAVPNEHSRMYASLGIEGVNAFTSFEQTVYIGDIPTNRLEAWATVEGERFADPVFRLFYPELEAVYEEKNLSLDRPSSRVWETLHRALFPRHPYGTQTTIGSVDHLKTPAYQDMVDYFHRWYVPNNMAIVLAGDIDAETALPVLEAQFGRLRPRPLEPPAPGEVVPLRGRVFEQVHAEGEEAVTMAWHTVPSSHDDEPALAVMDRLLDDAKVGLLNVELELTQQVPSAGSWHSTLAEAGYFGVRARVGKDQSPDEVEQLLLGVLEKLKSGEFTDADVEAAKLQHTVSDKLQLEFGGARARRMMQSFIEQREWADIVEREKRFQAVTRNDVLRVANQYIGPDFVVVHRLKGTPDVPKLEKPEITPVAIDPSRKSEFARTIETMEAPQLEPEWVVEGTHYVHADLPAGTMIGALNQRNDLFSVTYRVKRGYRKAPMLCHALELFELSGAGDASAEQLQKELYGLGSTINTRCDAEYSSIEVSGLDEKLEDTLAILDRWIADPKLEGGALERHYRNTLTKRRDGLEEDWRLTSALDLYAKYGKDSAWLRHPSNAQLERAKIPQLRTLLVGFFDHEHKTLYFGPRSADEVADVIARGKRHRKVGDVWTRRYRKVNAPEVFFVHKDGAKANVRFVIPKPPLPRERRPVARLLSEYLSGNMSALVFQEIRESRGLAYSAYSAYDNGRRPDDASGLLGYMSTQADKVPVGVNTFLELLRTDDIQPERLADAKVSLDQEFRATRIDPRWVTRWVDSWDELGEKQDPRPWLWQSVQALDLDQVKSFAAQFVDAPVIIAVIGDRDRVGLDALAEIGKVTELAPEDLFSYGPFPARRGSQAKTDAAANPSKK